MSKSSGLKNSRLGDEPLLCELGKLLGCLARRSAPARLAGCEGLVITLIGLVLAVLIPRRPIEVPTGHRR